MRLLGCVGGFAGVLVGSTAFGQVNAGLSVTAQQGFSRSLSTNAATVTVPNGVPGFVFGGTISPFVTGVVPVVSAGPQPYLPAVVTPVSPVRRMLTRGDIELQKDAMAGTRLIINELPTRVSAERRKSNTDVPRNVDSSNPFRRGIEKYAGKADRK